MRSTKRDLDVNVIRDAARELADALDGMVAFDVGEKFSCHQVEALVDLFCAVGREDVADHWIECHGRGDGCDDSHCPCGECGEV